MKIVKQKWKVNSESVSGRLRLTIMSQFQNLRLQFSGLAAKCTAMNFAQVPRRRIPLPHAARFSLGWVKFR